MARLRLVDPRAQVSRVAERALGVSAQAKQEAAVAELRRYRDAEDPRYAAPAVSGSTSDGTALVATLSALSDRGVIIDRTESVEDEVQTGVVQADEAQFDGIEAGYLILRNVVGRSPTLSVGSDDLHDAGLGVDYFPTLEIDTSGGHGDGMVFISSSNAQAFTVSNKDASMLFYVDGAAPAEVGTFVPLVVTATSNTALQVGRSGTVVFVVDTDTPSEVAVWNGVALRGYSGAGSTEKWELDSSTGDLTTSGALTVGGADGDIHEFRGMLRTKTAAPSAATVGGAMGTGGSVGVTITGNNSSGQLAFRTGTSGTGTSGTVLTFNFSTNRPSTSYAVLLTALDANTAVLMNRLYVTSRAVGSWQLALTTGTALATDTNHNLMYLVVGHTN